MNEILSNGANAADIAIALYLIRLDRRILVFEEWRKSVAAKLAAL